MKKREPKVKKIKEKNKKKRHFRFGYWLLVLIVAMGICVFVAGVGFCYYIVTSAPEFNSDKMFEKEATRVFDSKGELIATLGSEVREKITYDEIPQVLVDAIIATEDSRFFQHNGFDAPRFIKASISQVMGRGGGGASTLTMQLSKLAFTSTKDTGIEGIIRKFTDIYMAVFKMEKYYTKNEILEYYVNTPCMGGNIYGVQQASQYYFGKDAKDLNLVEAALIAGLFQSPNGYNPYNNPIDGNARKNTVLYLMKRHGYITDAEYQAGISVQIKDLLKTGTTSTSEYQGFIDTVVEEIMEETGNNPYEVPMLVYTTMDRERQDVINKFYKTHKFRDEKIQVGVGLVDGKTGALVAVGAGRNKTTALSLNVATFKHQIKRQPGSTIKPIMDYGPAIEYQNLSTYGPFVDDKTPYGGGYMKNFGKITEKVRTTKDCLSHSVNTCALQAFNMTTNEQKMEFVTNLGLEFSSDLTAFPPSYSIGAFNGTTPVEIAAAYATFGNGGYYTKPYTVTKIIYTENDDVYEPQIIRKRVMKPQTAYMIANILQAATPGSVNVSGTQVATKTGTTSYDSKQLKQYGLSSNIIPDSWISSFSADYGISIWIGYTDSLSKETVKNKWYLPNSGYAQPERKKILGELVNKLFKKNSKFKNPGGFVTAEVELETIPAQKPSAYTPKELKGSFMFIAGTEPNEVSTRFAKLTEPTNVTYNQSGNTLTLSWGAAATPEAINTEYLTNYFKEGYTIWADKYLQKRITYNNTKLGDFGYDIYLTSGTNSTYLGFTTDLNYTVNLSSYSGIYDGFIVKTAYKIFKSNASDGVKILFTIPVNETYDVSLNNLNQTLSVGNNYTILNESNVTSITLNGNDIKSEVTSLSVTLKSVTKDGNNIEITNLTTEAGTYNVSYSVSFEYNGKTTTKNFTGTITVN